MESFIRCFLKTRLGVFLKRKLNNQIQTILTDTLKSINLNNARDEKSIEQVHSLQNELKQLYSVQLVEKLRNLETELTQLTASHMDSQARIFDLENEIVKLKSGLN